MKIKPILLLVLLLFTISSIAQRRVRIRHVDANNMIEGQPYIILPKAAVKIKVSIIEFSYTIGDLLRKYVTIDTKNCTEEQIKKALAPLSDEYDVSTDVLFRLLNRDPKSDKEELKIYKMDRDVKMSVLSVLDPNKIYKYIRLKSPLNSGLLSLEYDENGILISSKQTDEPKLLPAIFSAVTGLAGIITAAKNASAPVVAKTDDKAGGCVLVKHTMEDELDKAIVAYNNYVTASVSIFTEKQFEKGREKMEEAMNKQLSKLFYSKTTRIIPVEMTFVIPVADPKNPSDEFQMFEFDKVTGKLNYLKNNAQDFLLTPKDRFKEASNLSNPVILKLSEIPKGFNKAAMLSNLVKAPDKLTVVYNIPQSMRAELLRPKSTEAYMDTIIKIPQRGAVGYFSMRPSNLELTYDNNGELRKITAERTSVLDQVGPGLTSAKDFITATKKEEKTELELLKEKADLFETLKKIRDLEKEDDQ